MSINCARCHNHPLEKWTQDQYWAFANLFARVSLKDTGRAGEVVVRSTPTGEALHLRRGTPTPPAPLDGEPLPLDSPTDRRDYFAAWLTSPDNPFFARSLVNRVWRNFMGRGLVEAEDDMRATNPATNPELLAALTDDFVAHGFDVKHLARTIMTSAAYQRSARPLPGNRADDRFYSRYLVRRLPAEVLLDAYSDVTGVPTPFDEITVGSSGGTKKDASYPAGVRAVQLPDSQLVSRFLDAFGRAERSQTCACERTDDATVSQALHLSNGDTLNAKLRDPNVPPGPLARRRQVRRGDRRRSVPPRPVPAADGGRARAVHVGPGERRAGRPAGGRRRRVLGGAHRERIPLQPLTAVPMVRPLLLVLAPVLNATCRRPAGDGRGLPGDGRLLAAGTRGQVVFVDPANGDGRRHLVGPRRAGHRTGVRPGRNARGRERRPVRGRRPDHHRLCGPGQAAKTVATLSAHDDLVYAIAFSPDGKTLATTGYDRLIKLWDWPLTDKSKPRLTLTDHSDAVYALSFHPTAPLLASASADRAVKVWDTATGTRLYTLSEPTDWLYAVAWSPDGKHLAAGGADRSVRVWAADRAGGRLVRSAFAHNGTVRRIIYTADGKTLVTTGDDRRIKAWDADKLVETVAFPQRPDAIHTAALRPDGKQLAVGSHDGSLVLFDTATGKVAASPLPEKPKPPVVTRLVPNAATRGQTVRVVAEGDRLDSSVFVTVTPEGGGTAPPIAPITATRTRMTFDLAIPADMPPGPLRITLTNQAGRSAVQVFQVDRFPAVGENELSTLPATVAGTLSRSGEIDLLRLATKAGQEVGVQFLSPLGRDKFDPIVTIADASGRTVAEGRNGVAGFVAEAGTYSLAVRDRDYRGGPGFDYRLHVGPVPVVTSVFPLAVPVNVDTTVRVTGVNLGGDRELTVRPPAGAVPGGTFGLPLTTEAAIGSMTLTIAEHPSVRADESGSAVLPVVPGTVDGVLTESNAAHTVRFTAKKGERLVVEAFAEKYESPVDPTIELLDADGEPVPRAVLRCTARVYVSFRDHDATKPGIRLETWDELGVDDYLFLDGDLVKIFALPRNPDDDCKFYEVGGKRVAFLGTTPTHHAQGTAAYKVEVHPPGSTFPPNGMPVFPLAYRNDDGGPGYGRDSRLVFDPPADGEYQVRIADAAGGDRPGPRVPSHGPPAAAGLPGEGVAVGPEGRDRQGRADHRDRDPGRRVRRADRGQPRRLAGGVRGVGRGDRGRPGRDDVPPGGPDGAANAAASCWSATADVDGKPIVRRAPLGPITPTEPGDIAVSLTSAAVPIAPGGEARLRVRVDRRNGFAGRVPLEVKGLPHGVRVLNVGLNGILVLPANTEREIVLAAEPWVKPTDRPFVVVARHEKNKTDHAAWGRCGCGRSDRGRPPVDFGPVAAYP